MGDRSNIFTGLAMRIGGRTLIRSSAGGAAVLGALVGVYLLFGPTYVSRGLMDVPLLVLGKSYGAYVNCDDTSAVKPSLLKSFIGIHEGQHARQGKGRAHTAHGRNGAVGSDAGFGEEHHIPHQKSADYHVDDKACHWLQFEQQVA